MRKMPILEKGVYVGQEFEGGKKKTEEKTRQDFRSGQFR
jgi:hypothetical protein